MTKKRFWPGMLVLVLVFGMMVVSCGDSGDDPDVWSDVTSLTQLNGTWKGSYSDSKTEQGITIKLTFEITMTIIATDANSGTASGIYKTTMSFSGNGINDLWSKIKGEYEGEDGVTFNDSTHSISITETMPAETLRLSDMAGAKINQNGTKVKMPADEDEPEIIFIKQ